MAIKSFDPSTLEDQRDWTARSYLGETGFSRAFLLCHRYNVREILIPNWLNRRKYIKLAVTRQELDQEYRRSHASAYFLRAETGIPTSMRMEDPTMLPILLQQNDLAKVTDWERRDRDHWVRTLPENMLHIDERWGDTRNYFSTRYYRLPIACMKSK